MSINRSSSILDLSKRPTKALKALDSAGIQTISDLFWLLPLRVEEIPPIKSFQNIQADLYFQGFGKVISVQSRPSFQKSRGRAFLTNTSIFVDDYFSESSIELKWFNSYPSFNKKISQIKYLTFSGRPQEYRGMLQFINPDISPVPEEEIQEFLDSKSKEPVEYKIQYPTINSVRPTNIKKIIDKIPPLLWEDHPELLDSKTKESFNLPHISDAFKLLHGKIAETPHLRIEDAKRRLIYEEFLHLSLKVMARRKNHKSSKVTPYKIDAQSFLKYETHFPYKFTQDQKRAIKEIINDFNSDFPMMRLIQGDVGCGKTTVAIMASWANVLKNLQVAVMCPTEVLAQQHLVSFNSIFNSHNEIKIALLTGSTPLKEKKEIYQKLENGDIHIIIGTHSLIQESVVFKRLGLVIIDEQHKFGVGQRLALAKKGPNPHCLIMTATPIPRSLSLTQYGDLDISIIKEIPPGRKGTKTRIIGQNNFQQFLSFVKTRIRMGEQVYVVVPAIEENEEQDIVALESAQKKFQEFFPDLKIKGLHGQLKANEKEVCLEKFSLGKYHILISTSVIEVGINIPNATIMAIMNPNRFGLSSLHQLRGRVGRGEKPGFCFLINTSSSDQKGLQRLKIIENSTDGFVISEEDLKLRGQGNLFGAQQSGNQVGTKIANIIDHQDLLESARNECERQIKEGNKELIHYFEIYSKVDHISKTI